MMRHPWLRSIWQPFTQPWRRIEVLSGVLVLGAIAAIRCTGGFQFLELVTLDRMLRLRPTEPLDESIVIIGITEADIQQIGHYPIPDQVLADLLQTLQTAQPAVIGLDLLRDLPVEPGQAALTAAFQSMPNVIGIEQAPPSRDGATVAPPPALPDAQVGFADALLDSDGFLRRSLLGSANPQGEYRFSLTIRLAKAYLAQYGIKAANGRRDPEAFRFGETELTRFQPDTGGYVRADAGGNQILLNFRSGTQPFRVVTLEQIRTRQFDPQWLRGRIVLIGVMAMSAKDVINTGAIAGVNPGVVYGVEIQAHAISQIIQAVRYGRPLLQGWGEGWDLLWLVGWGGLGIAVGSVGRSPWKALVAVLLLGVSVVGVAFGLLLLGWWVPLVPTVLVLLLNGMGLTIAAFYRYEQDLHHYEQDIQQLEERQRDRQQVIEHTFDAIHNGPLQTLAIILSNARAQQVPPVVIADLQRLNQELRGVYDAVRQEIVDQTQSVRLGSDRVLDLRLSLAELLYEVYYDTLKRDLPGFQTLTVQIVNLDAAAAWQPPPAQSEVEIKRGLCRFLEEALCNVGKHAIGATRLSALWIQENDADGAAVRWVLRVVDNGKSSHPDKPSEPDKPNHPNQSGVTARSPSATGFGTQQALNLAQQLGGTFQRYPHHPHGMVSELSWRAPSA